MGHLQPSRVTSRVTSSQKWQTSSPPATFVRNRVLYVKFLPKFSARAARSLAMQIRKSHPESHPCKIQRTQVTSDHIQQSHPGKIQLPVTSEWSHPQSHPDKIQSLPGAHPTCAAACGARSRRRKVQPSHSKISAWRPRQIHAAPRACQLIVADRGR